MKRILLIISVLTAYACSLNAQNEQASLLSRDSILIGDQVQWKIPISLSEGENAYFVQPSEPVAPGVETVMPFHIDTVSNRKGVLKIEAGMILTAFDSGTFVLPPMTALVQRVDGTVDTLTFEGHELAVNTIPIDTASFQPYDIKGQITFPLTFKEVFPWVLLVFAIAAGIWALVRFIRNRRQNKDFFGREKVVDPPHIVALRSLDRIRSQKLWQNNKQKQFYTAVTDTLRIYMAERYDFPAMEQTSAEIFDNLKDKDIEPSLLDSVKDLFTTADYVKFAKHNASEQENEDAIPVAVRFVNSTFMQQLEDEQKKEGAE